MVQFNNSWDILLKDEFQKPYYLNLRKFLVQEYKTQTIYPNMNNIFNALKYTDYKDVKVVILGQDPYHGPKQAHGLCFSVQPGVQVPPSLVNIYKELHRDLGVPIVNHGYLQSWADQGVLLLNATLTVNHGQAGSHQGQGWETFTDRAIDVVNRECDHVVFLLWGSYAQKKAANIDATRHLILKAPHPSPLSAYRGFIGCGHFSQANQFLEQQGKTPIHWGSIVDI